MAQRRQRVGLGLSLANRPGSSRVGALAASTQGYLNGLSVQPAAVLSLRKLVSSATVALRVRRSSDNDVLDIGFTGNALDTSALATFVGANSGFVVTWYDQTGNGEHATQTVPASQPRIVNAGTYLGEVEFDGVDDSLKISLMTMGTAYAGLYANVKKASMAGTEIMFELSDNYNLYGGTAFTVYSGLNVGMSNTNVYGSAAFTAMKRLSILFNKTPALGVDEVKLWLDGMSQDPPTSTAHTDTTGTLTTRDFFIGARNSASLFSDQSLESLVLYNSDTTTARADIEGIVKIPFAPAQLFAAGEQGIWFDPSDFSTLWQDTAGTIAVTATGQTVKRVNDKSGRGHHMTNAGGWVLNADGARYYLAAPGTNAFTTIDTVNFSTTDKATIWSGTQIDASADVSGIVSNGENADGFSLMYANNATWVRKFRGEIKQAAGTAERYTVAQHTLGQKRVVVGIYDIAGATGADEVKFRINGAGDAGTTLFEPAGASGALGNRTMFVGTWATTWYMTGRLYSVIVRAGASTAEQISDGETYVNNKTGAY